MRSVKARFIIESDKNPYASTYICFSNAISHQRYSRRVIHRWFLTLVDENDYDITESKQIIDHLLYLSNKKKPPDGDGF